MNEEQHNSGFAAATKLGYLVIILVATVLITAAVFWQARKAELTRFRSQFESDASGRVALIKQETDKSLFAIKSLGWFLHASGRVDQDLFKTFAADCLAQRNELQALSWNPRVPTAERAGFEQKAQQEGKGRFEIHDRTTDGRFTAAPDRAVYYPVLYIEPMGGNEAALGFDVASDAVRRAALERARDTGEPTVTEPIQLVQQQGPEPGFLIFVPVYREDLAKTTVEERRAALQGFAVGVYQVGTLVSAALRGVEPIGSSLVLLDHSAPGKRQLIYAWDDMPKGDRSWKHILFPAAPRVTKTYQFAGREWEIEILANPAYMERYSPISYWLILPVGFLLGLVAVSQLWRVLSSGERMGQLIAKRTAELCQIQERLRLVLDAIPVRVHWKDRNSVYLGCNRRFAEDAEVKSPDEVVGKTDFELPWKQFAPLFQERDRKVIESGEPMLNYEQPRSTSDGRVLCLLQSKLPLRDAEGQIIGVLSCYEDITERKRAEEALRESEARYRAVVESSSDGIVVTVEDKLVYVNPATIRLIGAKEAADLLGHSRLEFVPELYHAELGRRRAQMLATGRPAPAMEAKLRCPDGRIIDVEFMGVPIVYDGKPAILSSFRDITQRKQAEEALRQSQEQLRERAEELETIMGCAPVALWVAHDPQCNFISGNRMAGSFDENTRQENWSANVSNTLRWFRDGRELKAEELPMQQAATQDREIQNAEMELLLPSGRRVNLLGSATPLRDGQGRVRGCVGAFLDNTDRKHAECLLAGEKRVLEWIAKRKPMPELLNEICRFIDDLSPGVMSSILLLEADGTQLRPIAAPKLPAEWTRAISPLPIGPGVGSCGSAAWVKEQVVVSDITSDPRWTEYPDFCALALRCGLQACWSTPILSGEGELLGTFAMYYPAPRSPSARDLEVIRQVTHLASIAIEHHRAAEALRQSEERLSLVVEAAKIGTWDWDLNKGELVWSAQCRGLYGVGKEEPMTYRRFLKALHPEDRERVGQAVRKALESHDFYQVEMRTVWRDGSLHWVGSRGRAFYNEAGQPVRMSGAALDITGRKKAEEDLQQAHDALAQANIGLERKVQERTAELVRANERLQELDRLKSQFLATMSHELRTPLNSIIGFTGILRQGFAGPVNEEQKKQLGLVFSSAKHLLSLINDLLDLSRIEAGKVDLENAPFNFTEVVDEVVQTLTPMARQKNLNLVTDLPGGVIEMVGDRKRSYQLLLNLANNAVKFTEKGEVKISARTDGEQLRVCVADTGIGIKPEQMGMLFEAFRQLDGSAKRVYEGTGLGLHLCRRLLKLMHGDIHVESEFGKGSCFSFTLPRQGP